MLIKLTHDNKSEIASHASSNTLQKHSILPRFQERLKVSIIKTLLGHYNCVLPFRENIPKHTLSGSQKSTSNLLI